MVDIKNLFMGVLLWFIKPLITGGPHPVLTHHEHHEYLDPPSILKHGVLVHNMFTFTIIYRWYLEGL